MTVGRLNPVLKLLLSELHSSITDKVDLSPSDWRSIEKYVRKYDPNFTLPKAHELDLRAEPKPFNQPIGEFPNIQPCLDIHLCVGYKEKITRDQLASLIYILESQGIKYRIINYPKNKQANDQFLHEHAQAIAVANHHYHQTNNLEHKLVMSQYEFRTIDEDRKAAQSIFYDFLDKERATAFEQASKIEAKLQLLKTQLSNVQDDQGQVALNEEIKTTEKSLETAMRVVSTHESDVKAYIERTTKMKINSSKFPAKYFIPFERRLTDAYEADYFKPSAETKSTIEAIFGEMIRNYYAGTTGIDVNNLTIYPAEDFLATEETLRAKYSTTELEMLKEQKVLRDFLHCWTIVLGEVIDCVAKQIPTKSHPQYKNFKEKNEVHLLAYEGKQIHQLANYAREKCKNYGYQGKSFEHLRYTFTPKATLENSVAVELPAQPTPEPVLADIAEIKVPQPATPTTTVTPSTSPTPSASANAFGNFTRKNMLDGTSAGGSKTNSALQAQFASVETILACMLEAETNTVVLQLLQTLDQTKLSAALLAGLVLASNPNFSTEQVSRFLVTNPSHLNVTHAHPFKQNVAPSVGQWPALFGLSASHVVMSGNWLTNRAQLSANDGRIMVPRKW